MDYKAIINLMKEMDQTELTKLEIEEEGFRICLEKAHKPSVDPCSNAAFTQNQLPYPLGTHTMSYPQTVSQIASNMTGNITSTVPAAGDIDDEASYKKLVSPMVGTFYSQPSPDKPAFVKVGDKIKKGQPICIIEAMKLMNEIESEHDGEIVKVLVDNEEMVEFGQPMFLIK